MPLSRVQIIDSISDREGVAPGDVVHFPEELAKYGLSPEDVTPGLVHQVEVFQRSEVDRIRKALFNLEKPQMNAATSTAEPLLVKEDTLRDLYKLVGFKVDTWPAARLINKLPKLLEAAQEDLSGPDDVMTLLESIDDAQEDGVPIDIEGQQKQDPPKKTSKKTAAKKTTKKATKKGPAKNAKKGTKKTSTPAGRGKKVTKKASKKTTKKTTKKAAKKKAPTAPTAKKVTKKTTKKTTKKAAKKTTKKVSSRGVGVIASIRSILEKATEKRPLTREKILEKLCQIFPDRTAEAMKQTVSAQVPSRFINQRQLDVRGDGKKGFWIET